MAAKLGVLFLNAAMGPLNYAGQCIMQGRVKNGINELAAESLMGAVQRGIATVANAAGLPISYVTNLLPVNEIAQVAARIADNQRVAMEQWEVHTGHVGGLLDGVADLTIDNRPPDASLCLLRVSKKMQLDKQLAVPLRQLSEDLVTWQELIGSCRTFIDDGHSLESAYRQRRLVRWAAAIAVSLAMAVVAVWLVRVRLARARVDEVLAHEDPCTASSADPSDVAKSTDGQKAKLTKRKNDCEAKAEAVRAAEEEKQRLATAARLAEEEKAARLGRCDELAKSLATGPPQVTDLDEAKPHAELLARIVSGKLVPADIGALEGFPCLDTAAATPMAERYLAGVLATAAIWMYTEAPSKVSADLIVMGKKGVTERQLTIFDRHIEEMAKRAVRTGDEVALTRVSKLCALKPRLEMSPGQYCEAASTILKSGDKP